MNNTLNPDAAIRNLRTALEDTTLVQSFSGVRTRFGEGPGISPEHEILACAYGFCYARQILSAMPKAALIIGRDPRPTGDAVASALAFGFLAGAASLNSPLTITDLGIITTPLIETAVRALKADGGVMITASHNPINDNGFKFLTGVCADHDPNCAPPGALLAADTMRDIVDEVRRIADSDPDLLIASLKLVGDEAFKKAYGSGEDQIHRVKAERAYLDFLGKEWGVQPHCLKPLTLGPVLVDPNGGAACGIAARVLEHFGVRAIEVNAETGYPEHAIDTDGIDPASGKHMLLRVSRAALRENARFGIAFDYDADRGNIVLPGMDESAIIKPQTVSTLNVALALAHREISGRHHNGRLAIVMSEATSGSCNRVAEMFNAEVFTVETGEINVVTRMHQLRKEGYDVPVGVEGANGGSIFGEATCRDGLMTSLCAALADEHPDMADQWMRVLRRNGNGHASKDVLRLPEILAGIPVNFNTMIKIQCPNIPHGELKSRMESHFADALWPDLSKIYKAYRFANYEGTQERVDRTSDQTGGWRVVLDSDEGMSFIFARGSRTEAGIWRMIIDDPVGARGETLLEATISMMNHASDGQAVIRR
ncbi:MAG: hypothetical protein ACYC0V_06905 [Armatimonadota bacterium]